MGSYLKKNYHTILIIKYSKQKNSTLTNSLGFHIVPLKKKTENNKNLNTKLKKF